MLTNAKVYESGIVIGFVNDKSSKETELLAGTFIVMGGCNAQLGTIGVGMYKNFYEASEACVRKHYLSKHFITKKIK